MLATGMYCTCARITRTKKHFFINMGWGVSESYEGYRVCKLAIQNSKMCLPDPMSVHKVKGSDKALFPLPLLSCHWWYGLYVKISDVVMLRHLLRRLSKRLWEKGKVQRNRTQNASMKILMEKKYQSKRRARAEREAPKKRKKRRASAQANVGH